MTDSTVLLALTMIVLGLISLFALIRLNRRLKVLFPSEWIKIGDAFKYESFSIPREWRWNKFIFLRQYRKLGDKQVTRLGDVLFFSSNANFCLGIIWILFLGSPLKMSF